MKNFNRILNLLFIVILLQTSGFSQNPIVQTHYTADPAPMVHDGRVYVYTSHDEDETVRNFFTMNDWRCYSSTDMVNWTDHGAVLSYKDFEWSRGDAWAGQCIYRNGKFYFYVPVNEKNGGNAIGVAVSDSPTGPFKDAIGEPLIKGYGYIDPTVFIDDDGQAYMYWGNPNLWHVKLNDDMLSYDEEYGIVKEELRDDNFGYRSKKIDNRTAAYEEGPWMYKRNNLYYLFYPAGGVPEHLAYSTGPSVTGPWTYGDTIMHVIQEGGAFTNHPGVIDYKGQTYLFYHNGALPGGGGFKRSVCVEPFEFNSDGSVPLIEPTIEGVKKSVYFVNPCTRVQAETMAWSKGLKTATDSETGVYVTKIENGDHLIVRSVDFSKGVKSFVANVASASQGGKIEIRLDNPDGKLLGTIDVKNTGAWKKWTTVKGKVKKTSGVNDICFVFKGRKGELFNFDWWKFE